MRLFIICLSCLALFSACSQQGESATQILGTINSDLVPGVQLARVEVAVFDPTGTRVAGMRSFQVTDSDTPGEGEVKLPFSFGIKKGKDERFLLAVTGYGPDSQGEEHAVVEQKALAGFERGRLLQLKIFLGAACYTKVCSDARLTCYLESTVDAPSGSCGEVRVADTARVTPGRENDWRLDGGSTPCRTVRWGPTARSSPMRESSPESVRSRRPSRVMVTPQPWLSSAAPVPGWRANSVRPVRYVTHDQASRSGRAYRYRRHVPRRVRGSSVRVPRASAAASTS